MTYWRNWPTDADLAADGVDPAVWVNPAPPREMEIMATLDSLRDEIIGALTDAIDDADKAGEDPAGYEDLLFRVRATAPGLSGAAAHDAEHDVIGPPEKMTCTQHGDVEIAEQGSYTGYAGGRCWFIRLSCGCTANDESADVRAAR